MTRRLAMLALLVVASWSGGCMGGLVAADVERRQQFRQLEYRVDNLERVQAGKPPQTYEQWSQENKPKTYPSGPPASGMGG